MFSAVVLVALCGNTDSANEASALLALTAAFPQSASAPTAPPVVPPLVTVPSAKTGNWQLYLDAATEAVRTNRRLVVWVGQEPDGSSTWLSCRVESFPGVSSSGAVLAVPDGRGWLHRIGTMDGYATAEMVLSRFYSAGYSDGNNRTAPTDRASNRNDVGIYVLPPGGPRVDYLLPARAPFGSARPLGGGPVSGPGRAGRGC